MRLYQSQIKQCDFKQMSINRELLAPIVTILYKSNSCYLNQLTRKTPLTVTNLCLH